MKDEELLALDREGFFPGPGETEGAYLQRVEEARLPVEGEGEPLPRAHWEWSRLHLEQLFDFAPRSLPAFYSNRYLSPWEGAAAWIEGGKLKAIQLRTALKKGSFLKIYRREEILTHEAVHAARSALSGRRFEEFFAYMTSESKWRRVLGPIVERPREVYPFVASLLGALGCTLGSLFWEPFLWGAKGFYLFGAVWLFLGFSRLIRRHWTLRRCAGRLIRCGVAPEKVRAVLIRLTDEEIFLFAKGKEGREYIDQQGSLRWRLLRFAYFS